MTEADAKGGTGASPTEYLPRLLSKWHVASRKQAELLVRAGRVSVNGDPVRDVLRRVDSRRDRIAVDGRAVAAPAAERSHWLLLNKPRGVLTTVRDPEGRETVMDLLGSRATPGLFPVGRLDRASAGLLLLTDDHAAADRLLDPRRAIPRLYRVRVKGRVRSEDLARAAAACTIDGVRYRPMDLVLERDTPAGAWLRVGLTEGKNREIRRRFEAIGLEVLHLIRLEFGPIVLGDLAPGASRPLRPGELDALRALTR
ncbi:MAG: pseudouridine synthase [Planctomycetota bacterium]